MPRSSGSKTNMSLRTLLFSFLLPTAVLSHMMVAFPAPIRSKFDPHASSIDYDYTSPLHADGSNFPCKGYLGSNEPSAASFTAGQTYNMSFSGSATHNGGTCQLTVSYDEGKSFKVIKSMIGACPQAGGGGRYDFTIPSFAPAKQRAVFAWSWINHSGNREFYMDCSYVDIANPDAGSVNAAKWTQLPNIFVANLAGINSCRVPEGTDVVPPRPGKDVVYGSGISPASPAWPGNCEWNGAGGGSGVVNAAQAGSPAGQSAPQVMPKPASFAEGPAPPAKAYGQMYSPGPASTLRPVYRPVAAAAAVAPAEACQPTVTVTVSGESSTSCSSSSSAGISPISRTGAHTSGSLAFADTANLAAYLPCQPGAFLCTSRTTFMTCAQDATGWAWKYQRQVAGGMACQPSLSGTSRVDQYIAASAADASGAAAGSVTPLAGIEAVNRAQQSTSGVAAGASCSAAGSMGCSNGGRGFMLCNNGAWSDMGSVAAGTKCQDGAIVPA